MDHLAKIRAYVASLQKRDKIRSYWHHVLAITRRIIIAANHHYLHTITTSRSLDVTSSGDTFVSTPKRVSCRSHLHAANTSARTTDSQDFETLASRHPSSKYRPNHQIIISSSTDQARIFRVSHLDQPQHRHHRASFEVALITILVPHST